MRTEILSLFPTIGNFIFYLGIFPKPSMLIFDRIVNFVVFANIRRMICLGSILIYKVVPC